MLEHNIPSQVVVHLKWQKLLWLIPHKLNSNSKSVIIYYAKIYSKMYINLSTLIPVGVGVKVPAGSLLNSKATQLTISAQSTWAYVKNIAVA